MAMINKTAKQPMEQKASYAKVSDTVMGGTERTSLLVQMTHVKQV